MMEYFRPLTKQRLPDWLGVAESSGSKIARSSETDIHPGFSSSLNMFPNMNNLSPLLRRLVWRVWFAKSVVHLCGGFHDLSLHHRHYVCHVSTKFFHRRFSDRRAVKIGQRLQLFSCEIL